jgi:uncharacterized iron-regulated protein
MKKLLLLLMLCPLLAFAQEKLSDSHYKIYSVKAGKEVSIKGIVQEMRDYDVLFFGEEHNDSVAHFLEKSILELLQLKFGSDLALSLEMFDRDVQPVMNEYLKNFMREKSFIRDARAWTNYPDYKPMILFAKENGMEVICANAPGRYAYLAGKRGQKGLEDLPEESKAFFAPVPYDTATGEYLGVLAGMAGHGPSAASIDAKTASSPGFYLNDAQSLWDATMGYSVSQYLKKNKTRKVMHVSGKYHTDSGFGVVSQFKSYSSKSKPLIVSANIGDEAYPNIDWAKYKKCGDFIIVTDPSVPRTFSE